jgi:hypothetical protein
MAKIFRSFALLGLLLAGCSSQPTQVIVTVDAESGVRAAATQLHLVVGERFDRVLMPGAGEDPAYPFELALAPLDGDVSRTWSVAAEAGGALVRAVGGYVEGQTLFVTLLLEDSCRGVVCGDEETCQAGACVGVGVVGMRDAGPAQDAGVDLGRDAGGVRDGGPVDGGGNDAGETCPAFVPGTWTRTTTPSGCGAGGGTTTTVLPGMTSVADLNYCPSGAASCHRFDTACRSYINGTLPPQSFEREVRIGLDGVVAIGTLVWTPGSCTFGSVWQRTGP